MPFNFMVVTVRNDEDLSNYHFCILSFGVKAKKKIIKPLLIPLIGILKRK